MNVESLNTQKLTGSIGQEAADKLPQGDPRLALLKGILSGEVAAVGTTERRFLATCQQSMDNFSLLDLPPDVAQLILDSRAQSMQEFFDTWSESIRENAKKDKKAHKRYRQKKKSNTPAFDPALARRNMRLTLTRAKDSGHISTEYHQNMMDSLQPSVGPELIDDIDREQQQKLLDRLSDIGERLAKLSHTKNGLNRPDNGGISLRSTNKV
mgnify:CR=1 FL=1